MTIHELLALTGLTGSDEIPVWDAEASGEPTKKITAQNLAAAIKALASLLGTGDVVNDLTSTATDLPGSANMLKVLADMIAFEVTTISNTNLELSIARFGRVVTVLFSAVKNLATGNNTDVATLPAGFRPWDKVVEDMKAPSTGYDCRVTINTTGIINIYNYSSNTGNMNIQKVVTFIAGT